MDVVALGGQADECAAHGNYVVVRVRAEDKDRLGIRFGRYRTGAVIGIGLSAGPSGDGVL